MNKYDYMQGIVIDNEDISPDYIIPFIENTETKITGIESLDSDLNNLILGGKIDKEIIGKFKTSMCKPCKNNDTGVKLHVRTRDGKNFRLYMNGNTYLTSPQYINNFVKFLDGRKEGDTVTIHLGFMVFGLHIYGIGAIISSMMNCKAKIITFAGGRCGFPESVIWCYGKERILSDYGTLQFDGSIWLKDMYYYKHYFTTFLNKAKEIGILNSDQVNDVLENNRIVNVFP